MESAPHHRALYASDEMTTGYELRQRGDLEVLTWPAFDGLGVDALVTTRHGGVSAGDYATLNLSFSVGDRPQNVLENRRRAAGALSADPADFAFATQVHGAVAQVVAAGDRGGCAPGATVGKADALVTSDPGTVLAVLVADCVPIVLYDAAAHVLACVHAGWRGTVARVTGAALAAMGTLGATPGNTIAAIGPAIGPDRYQVGGEVAEAARESFGPGTSKVIRPDGTGRWLFDLWAANHLILSEAGVQQIHLAAVPTGELFFSDRAARPCGRFAAIARLRSCAG